MKKSTKRTVLIIASLSSFIVPFIGSSVNIALPTIGKEFKVDAVTLSWVPTSYLLASAMFLLPFGRAADIYGRKKIFLTGFIMYTIGSLLSALSISDLMLIACRVIQGIGSAMTFGTAMAILTSVYPPQERGRAIGITTASVYTGLSLRPFLGGFLTQHLGWRSIFYANVPLGLVIIFLVVWRLEGEWAEARGEKIDTPGSILYALTLLLIIYGLSSLPSIIFYPLILGFGFALFSSPNTNAVMSSLERRYFGVASGTIGTMRLVGQMFSMGMAMMIFSIVIGKVRITPELYPLFLRSAKIALGINGTLCFIGIFFSLARGKLQRQDMA